KNLYFLRDRVAAMKKAQAAQQKTAEEAAAALQNTSENFLRSMVKGAKDWGNELASSVQDALKRFAPIKAVFDNLQSQIDQLALSERDLLIKQLKGMDATAAEIRGALMLFDELQAKEQSIARTNRVKELLEDLLTPTEQLA